MKRIAVILTLCMAWLAGPVLADPGIRFDGDTYRRQFASDTPEIRLVEYVRAGETLQNWTRLLAVRNFTRLDNPREAVTNLARVVKQHNPEAGFQIIAKDDGSEALIDFLTWPKEGGDKEFNIHRYLKVEGHPGLISYQFAYRFGDASPTAVETFKKNRRRWIEEMTRIKPGIAFGKK